MNEFLNELETLLVKHKATILRSAASTSKLVVSLEQNDNFDEIEFDEEINYLSIKHGWFKQI